MSLHMGNSNLDNFSMIKGGIKVMVSRLLVYTEKQSTNDTLGLFQYYLFNVIFK